jgi:3',5'-cyclic AMP phosphodiesterase CpdA
MTTPTTLIQITDTHIKRPGALAYQQVDTAAFLRRAITHLNTMSLHADAAVITGDLVDAGSLDEYVHLKSLLDELSLPYYLLVGNHDARDTLRAVFKDSAYLFDGGASGHTSAQPSGQEAGLASSHAFVQYAVDIGDLHLIALDSLNPGHPGGTLCDVRLAWLEEKLAAAANRPVIVALHHPPFTTGIGHMDKALLDAESTAKLAAVISRYPNVERIIAGHLHREIHARFAGTLVSTAGSVAHQVALDLRPDAPSAFRMDPPSFVAHHWMPGAGLASHLGFIGDYAGPFPFHDEAGRLID